MTASIIDLAAAADTLSRLRILSDWVILQHQGVKYPNYRIETSGALYIWKAGRWQTKNLHARGDYLGYNVSNPITRKPDWIMAHAATAESFRGGWKPGLVACHAPGKAKTDFALGSCIGFFPEKANRSQRHADGTGGTFGTSPGKLTDREVQWLLKGWYAEPNVSLWARRLRCQRPNIRHHLRKLRVTASNRPETNIYVRIFS